MATRVEGTSPATTQGCIRATVKRTRALRPLFRGCTLLDGVPKQASLNGRGVFGRRKAFILASLALSGTANISGGFLVHPRYCDSEADSPTPHATTLHPLQTPSRSFSTARGGASKRPVMAVFRAEAVRV